MPFTKQTNRRLLKKSEDKVRLRGQKNDAIKYDNNIPIDKTSYQRIIKMSGIS